MKLEATATFLDGVDRFEVGDIRTVEDSRGARLIANGWAREFGGQSPAVANVAATSLDVHNAVMGMGDSNG